MTGDIDPEYSQVQADSESTPDLAKAKDTALTADEGTKDTALAADEGTKDTALTADEGRELMLNMLNVSMGVELM